MEELIIYFIAVNLTAFLLFAVDKKRAIARQWRIPEALLLVVSAVGGGFGGYTSMQIFRHKTKKPIFMVCMPIFVVLQIASLIYYIKSA